MPSLSSSPPPQTELSPHVAARLEAAAFWLLIATLAWAPFPLGSNRPWSWTVLVLLVAAAALLWAMANWHRPGTALAYFGRLAGPIVLGLAALLWGVVQIAPWVPADWTHPVWAIAADALKHPLAATISLDPWRTGTEVMKLATYGTAMLLAAFLARPPERASRLLTALIAIGAFYAAYGFCLGLFATSQYKLLYPALGYNPGFRPGPFVLHNSFATYLGLMALCAGVKLADSGRETFRIGRGFRLFLHTAARFFSGRGMGLLLAFFLILSMLIATASRAGSLAAAAGFLAIVALAIIRKGVRAVSRWSYAGALAIALLMGLAFLSYGDSLMDRFDGLVETDMLDRGNGRLLFWTAAERMINDAPLLGLGLGTFEPSFPMYAGKMLPYIVDKAHNDYLELMAGWGLPAAISWLAAMTWCGVLCMRGYFVRHRRRIYPLIGAGAAALVAFHSAFDFSLQIPAVALTFAVILGLGLAQAFPTRPGRKWQ